LWTGNLSFRYRHLRTSRTRPPFPHNKGGRLQKVLWWNIECKFSNGILYLLSTFQETSISESDSTDILFCCFYRSDKTCSQHTRTEAVSEQSFWRNFYILHSFGRRNGTPKSGPHRPSILDWTESTTSPSLLKNLLNQTLRLVWKRVIFATNSRYGSTLMIRLEEYEGVNAFILWICTGV
jgi:hypothetical protein